MPSVTPDAVSPEDAEIVLAALDLRLKVSPYGASLRGLWRERAGAPLEEIVTVYTGAKGKVGGQGDVLIPFPGRVKDGRYTLDGESYQMERNDKDGPNAIHGFLRQLVWHVNDQTESTVTFAASLPPQEHAGYPFSLQAMGTYGVEADGMFCTFSVENTGDRRAPVAAGFHPYFTVGSVHIDADRLHVPMESILEFENLIPTGRVLSVEGTPLDFRQPRTIGATAINNCYLNPVRDADGLVRIRLENTESGRGVAVWMDRPCDYVVLYSGDPLPEEHRRRSLAIEPMTCASDAFNHPEWGLAVLEPGASLTGRWGVSVSPAA